VKKKEFFLSLFQSFFSAPSLLIFPSVRLTPGPHCLLLRQHSLIVEADYSYNSYALIYLNNSDLSISQKCFHCCCIFL